MWCLGGGKAALTINMSKQNHHSTGITCLGCDDLKATETLRKTIISVLPGSISSIYI